MGIVQDALDRVPAAPADVRRSLMADIAQESSRASASGSREARDGWVENRAPSGWLPTLDLRELWSFRELAVVLAGRDLRVRYKQTVLGIAWAVLQPLVAAAIFTIVLGRLAGVPSDGLPYAVFVYSGLVVWTYFAGGLEGVSQSLVRDRDLVTRTYFPRILAPVRPRFPAWSIWPCRSSSSA